jgi:hypothetical protein
MLRHGSTDENVKLENNWLFTRLCIFKNGGGGLSRKRGSLNSRDLSK